jgi:hypothetical protein
MSRQRIHFGFPTLKIPQVLGFELGQKTHIFLWVFTGELRVNYGFLRVQEKPGFGKFYGFYGKIMGFLWVNYGFLLKTHFFQL